MRPADVDLDDLGLDDRQVEEAQERAILAAYRALAHQPALAEHMIHELRHETRASAA